MKYVAHVNAFTLNDSIVCVAVCVAVQHTLQHTLQHTCIYIKRFIGTCRTHECIDLS